MSLVFANLLADVGDGYHHMDWGDTWWMWVWGTLMMGAFVALIVWAVRSAAGGAATGSAPPTDPNHRARELLAERYARGELDDEEYQHRLERLR